MTSPRPAATHSNPSPNANPNPNPNPNRSPNPSPSPNPHATPKPHPDPSQVDQLRGLGGLRGAAADALRFACVQWRRVREARAFAQWEAEVRGAREAAACGREAARCAILHWAHGPAISPPSRPQTLTPTRPRPRAWPHPDPDPSPNLSLS